VTFLGDVPAPVQHTPQHNAPPGGYDHLWRQQQWQPSPVLPEQAPPPKRLVLGEEEAERVLAEYRAKHGLVARPVLRGAEADAAYAAFLATESVTVTAERSAAIRALGFGLGLLALLGAVVWCVPPWWIVTHHHPGANAMSAGGVMQALVGLWIATTFIVGPAGLIAFFGGLMGGSER
jgi:hypothetical protein